MAREDCEQSRVGGDRTREWCSERLRIPGYEKSTNLWGSGSIVGQRNLEFTSNTTWYGNKHGSGSEITGLGKRTFY